MVERLHDYIELIESSQCNNGQVAFICTANSLCMSI